MALWRLMAEAHALARLNICPNNQRRDNSRAMLAERKLMWSTTKTVHPATVPTAHLLDLGLVKLLLWHLRCEQYRNATLFSKLLSSCAGSSLRHGPLVWRS